MGESTAVVWGPTLYSYLAILVAFVVYPSVIKMLEPTELSENTHSYIFILICTMLVSAFLFTAFHHETNSLFF